MSYAPLTDDEKRAVASLKRLAKRRPDTLWLYAGDGATISVMKVDRYGQHAVTDTGGVDPDYEVDTAAIPNDGGGW